MYELGDILMQHFTLLLAPVAKGRPRFGNGRTYTPAKTKAFESQFRCELRKQKGFRVHGPVDVTILFYLKKPQRPKDAFPCVRPDLDNFLKAVLDAANGILWNDDAQIVSLTAHKRYCDELFPRPCIFLTMHAL